MSRNGLGRRFMIESAAALFASALIVSPVFAGPIDASPVRKLLGGASDSALDKLAKPDAFYADTAIRILLPGTKGKLASKLLGFGDKLGVTTKLTKSLNDAAGLAAKEAKPVFRIAVDGLSLSDIPSLTLKGDGATQYLKSSAGPALRDKIRPLVSAALGKVGAFNQLSKLGNANSLLGAVGVSQAGLTDSVTDQTMSGIFSYMGKEEAALRSNPIGLGKSILEGLIK